MNDWIEALRERLGRGERCVLATVLGTRGSAPRAAGAKMVVTGGDIAGTIGGGNLEYLSIEEARTLLEASAQAGPRIIEHRLGPDLGQCCGGVVEVLLEPLEGAEATWLDGLLGGDAQVLKTHLPSGEKVLSPASSAPPSSGIAWEGDWIVERLETPAFELWLYGAGHVGHAVVDALGPLPCTVTWVDGRTGVFPGAVPANVRPVARAELLVEVDAAPDDAFHLVMTHDHALDLRLCERVLRREFGFLGLIGSTSKRTNFLRALGRAGLGPERLARMTCPIGVEGISGKRPAEIAAAVAAQLLIVAEAQARRPAAEAAGL